MKELRNRIIKQREHVTTEALLQNTEQAWTDHETAKIIHGTFSIQHAL